jgi:hypothetical protein
MSSRNADDRRLIQINVYDASFNPKSYSRIPSTLRPVLDQTKMVNKDLGQMLDRDARALILENIQAQNPGKIIVSAQDAASRTLGTGSIQEGQELFNKIQSGDAIVR